MRIFPVWGLLASALLFGCGNNDDSASGTGGNGATAAGGKSGSGGSTSSGGSSSGGGSSGGSSSGGSSGSAGATNTGGSAGAPSCGATTPSVTQIAGSIAHDSTITISGCGFGAKSHAAPNVWDVTSEQYVGGQNKNAYVSVGDGQQINDGIWQLIVFNQGETAQLSTSRAHRHARVSAHYFASGIKLTLGMPRYPDGSTAPPSTQKRFYLSFYRKLKNPTVSPGGGDGSCKLLRVDTPNELLNGMVFAAHESIQSQNSSSAGYVTSWVDAGPETTWVRWEFYVDRDKQWFDVWKNGHYQLGSWSNMGGTVEIRPPGDWRFRTGVPDCQFDPPMPANEPILPRVFGYDDGHDLSPGQEIDMSEIYFDDTPARVEVSDSATWDDSPTGAAHREVQGRLESWNDSTITLRLYQGAFDSLTGKYLYVIDENGVANANGYPL